MGLFYYVARHIVATTLVSPPASLPYNDGFDGADSYGWALINGTENNRWMVSDVTGNPGASLYISDNGSSNHYSGATSTVFAAHTYSLDSAGRYAYSFDWKCNGEDNRDFIRAALVPAQTILTAGDYSGFDNDSLVPAGGIALDGGHVLNQHTIWQTQCGTFAIDTPGNYIWVFMWHNDDNTYNQTPAAIDNVNLVPNDCPMPQNVTWEISADSLNLTWIPVGGEDSWEVSLGDSSAIVTSPNHTFTNLPLSIVYRVRIRTICGAGDTSLAFSVAIVNDRHLVTVTANNPAYGSITGGGMYYNGDTATLSATPFTGYCFIEWDDGDLSNPRRLLVTSDTTLMAIFEQQEGIEEIENSKLGIEIYPNPANGVTSVSIKGISGRVSIAVLDSRGREVMNENMECGIGLEKRLDIKGLAAGAYFVRITTEYNIPIIKKLAVGR